MDAPVTIGIEAPPDLTAPQFRIRIAAEAVGVKTETARTWIRTAALLGIPLTVSVDGRRLLSRHSTYRLAILAALAEAGVPCSEAVFRAVHRTTHKGPLGEPTLPELFGQLHLDLLEDGPVTIEVELSFIWFTTDQRLRELSGEVRK